jgi:hypothetical protein
MSRKKSPGRKNPPGKTKGEILRFALAHPYGFDETDLRVYLKKEYNITDPRGIKRHLGELEKKQHIIKITTPGKANRWLIEFNYYI